MWCLTALQFGNSTCFVNRGSIYVALFNNRLPSKLWIRSLRQFFIVKRIIAQHSKRDVTTDTLKLMEMPQDNIYTKFTRH